MYLKEKFIHPALEVPFFHDVP